MAFKDIDQRLIDECTKDILDFDKVQTLADSGADINAFDEEYERYLYEDILDYYIDRKDKKCNLQNLAQVSELFINKGLLLNPRPDDCDWFLPNLFKFLPPEKICVDTFKMLLDRGHTSFEDLNNVINENALDLHLNMFYFYEHTRYKEKDSLNYFLELMYWACAYQVKLYPEKCDKELLGFDWFNREKNKVELVGGSRVTGVFVEEIETHRRAEIQGWTSKY